MYPDVLVDHAGLHDSRVGTRRTEDEVLGRGSIVCDAQGGRVGDTLTIEVTADGTGSITEISESNNARIVVRDISEVEDEDGGIIDSIDRGPAILMICVGVVLISLTALYFGPSRVSKPFNRKK